MASPSPKKAVHILLPCIWIYCTPPFIKYSDQKNELKYCLHMDILYSSVQKILRSEK
jgi:hypothetical protein